MNQRSLVITVIVAVVVITVVSVAMDLPMYAGPVAAGVVALAITLFGTRRQQQAYMELAAEPNRKLEARVRAACAQAGCPDLPVVTVADRGRSVLRLHQGRLLVSPVVGDRMTDEELAALVLQEVASPPDLTRRVWLDLLMVPAGLVSIAAIVALVTADMSWLGLALPLIVVWTVVASRAGLLTRGTLHRIWEAYTRKGGDPKALVSAMVKLYAEGYGAMTPLQRRNATGPLRSHLLLLARLAGISGESLTVMAEVAGAPAVLYRADALSWRERIVPYRLLIWIGVWFLLLVLSVAVAMNLK